MQIVSTAKYVRISPKKLRLVALLVKGLSVEVALTKLTLIKKRAVGPILAVIKTAVADATNNHKLSQDSLIIKAINVSQGPRFKRWRPVARGIAHPLVRKTSHLKVVLEEKSKI